MFARLAKSGSNVMFGLTVAGVAAQSCIYTVEPGHRGLIFDRLKGILPTVKSEGMHFRIPVLQQVIVMDVRTQPRVISTVTGTKDLQTVNLSLRILSRPKISQLDSIYRLLGLDWNERVLPGICNEVLKAVVAQKDAAELLTLRDQVSMQIREDLRKRADQFNIELDDVSITHLGFSREFSRAIEEKQVAEQLAERAKFVVMKAEQEREALVIRSEGDSQAAKLVSDSINRSGRGLIELRRIETAQYIAEKLTENPNVQYLPSSGGNMLLNLPVSPSYKSN